MAIHDSVAEAAVVRSDSHGDASRFANLDQRGEAFADASDLGGVFGVRVFADVEFFGVGKISGIDANFLDPASGFEGCLGLEVDIGNERHMASNGIQGGADIFEVASIFDRGGRDSHDLATDLNEAKRLLHAGIGIHRVTGEHRLDADGIFSPNGRSSAFHFAGRSAERVTAEAGLHHFVS